MQDNTNPQNPNDTNPVVGPPPIITPTVPTEIPSTPPQPSPVRRRALVPTILGLILLVVGVGAGLLLVQQQQIFKQKAAGCLTNTECSANQECINGQCVTPSTGTSDCSNGCCTISGSNPNGYYIKKCSCSSGTGACNDNCVNAGTSACVDHPSCGSSQIDVVNSSGQEASLGGGRTEQLYNSGTTCTTPTGGGGGCQSAWCTDAATCSAIPGSTQSPGTGWCQPSNLVRCCPPSGGGGGGGTPPRLKACGNTCSSDSECQSPSANGSTVRCIGGTCQNTSCVGKTIPGANCDCSALNACGQGCSATVGLCQSGSICRYIVGPGCADNPNPARPTNTSCVPNALPTGWTTSNCVARDQGNSFILDASGRNPTTAEIQQACSPTPSASCTTITAYDTSWNPLTAAQLSQLQPGTTVRFTVTGTTSSGVFDKARFTINGTQLPEVTTKRPNSADFYQEYTIPAGATSFTVTSQLHHQALNQWF